MTRDHLIEHYRTRARAWGAEFDAAAVIELERGAEIEAALERLAATLMDIRAKARGELDFPSGLQATCLHMIWKAADAALAPKPDSE